MCRQCQREDEHQQVHVEIGEPRPTFILFSKMELLAIQAPNGCLPAAHQTAQPRQVQHPFYSVFDISKLFDIQPEDLEDSEKTLASYDFGKGIQQAA